MYNHMENQRVIKLSTEEIEEFNHSISQYAISDLKNEYGNGIHNTEKHLVLVQTAEDISSNVIFNEKQLKTFKKTSEVFAYLSLLVANWVEYGFTWLSVYMLDDRSVEKLQGRVKDIITEVPIKDIKIKVVVA